MISVVDVDEIGGGVGGEWMDAWFSDEWMG